MVMGWWKAKRTNSKMAIFNFLGELGALGTKRVHVGYGVLAGYWRSGDIIAQSSSAAAEIRVRERVRARAWVRESR